MRASKKKHISPTMTIKLYEELEKCLPVIPEYLRITHQGKVYTYQVFQYEDVVEAYRKLENNEGLWVALPTGENLAITQCEYPVEVN